MARPTADLGWFGPPLTQFEQSVLDFVDSDFPRVIDGNRKYIVGPYGLALKFDRVGKGQRWKVVGFVPSTSVEVKPGSQKGEL